MESFIDYLVEHPQPLSLALRSQQQFVDEADENVLAELLLNSPIKEQLTEENVNWWGLFMCSVLIQGVAIRALDKER